MAAARAGAAQVIDSDTHVEVTEATWQYMLPEEQQFKPTTGYPRGVDPSQAGTRYWIIDDSTDPGRHGRAKFVVVDP